MRKSKINRKTSETDISVEINLDGKGKFIISTGIGFLDHMLEQLSKHSLIDINLKAKGDLKVDDHHTTEDIGIALGEAISKALGEKKSIKRFGTAFIPMDETLTRVSLDLSNSGLITTLACDINGNPVYAIEGSGKIVLLGKGHLHHQTLFGSDSFP